MLSGRISIAFSTQRFQFSSVSPTIPAIRSMLTCGNPTSWIQSYARKISGDRWARPFSSRIESSKFSTPSDTRVMPISASVFTLSRLKVPGSHSNVTSLAVSQVNESERESLRNFSWRELR